MTTVGFIGLGIMGRPMCRNLLQAGHTLIVRDHKREPEAELAALGAKVGASPREVAAGADVVITMLTDTANVVEVLRGPDGVFRGARPGTIIVDMSTISPVETRELAAEAERLGLEYLDAPVSGGDVGARQGTLSIMAGGKPEVFDRILPIFQVLGKNIVLVGEAGAGQVCKLCNNIVVALTIEAVSEALLLARKAGADPAKVRAALLGGFAQSRVLDVHGQRMLDRNFEPGFRARLHEKDLNIALTTARTYGVPLPGTALVEQFFQSLVASGQGDADHSALMLLLEQMAGLDR